MKLDTINRRIRFAGPQPNSKPFPIRENDIEIFRAIARHGPLPSHYLYDLTGDNHLTNFKHRLTKLYNGFCANWTTHPNHECEVVHYLTRPERQFAGFYSHYQPVVYDLSAAAQAELAIHGDRLLGRTDPFLHRLMGACVSASIQLATEKAGHRFISTRDIIDHPKCPPLTKDAANPLAVPLSHGHLVPDNLIAIDYGGKYRRFVVEIDRKTESINSDAAKTAYGKKLENYIGIMRAQTFRDVWGISGMMVMTVTTNALHMQHMIDYYKTLGAPELASKFIFKWVPHFNANWRVPPVYEDILQGWITADGQSLDLSTP